MVPLALGTQTNGSVLRPASYCGVYGYKPSHGLISRQGVLKQSRILDQIGVFARTIGDAALIARQLVGYDGKDPDVPRQARLDLDEGLTIDPNVQPRVAFVKTPIWEKATDTTKAAFRELNEQWGGWVREVEMPEVFDYAVEWHRTIMESDLAVSYAAEYAAGKDRLSGALREMIERGQHYTSGDYRKAQEGIGALTAELDKIFSSHEVILTPATTGEAPMGLDYTGSPIFCTIWTLCGVPAISLPILKGQDDMPMGVQLVASKGADGRLLRVAQWLADRGERR
jgi:Asp-tRNA(Asn)/Glu-tRNA(Gln) amidotransferase A subunit family amidase